MKKNVLNEINQMKFLFGYKPGRVISEQELPEMYEDYIDDELEEGPEMEISDFDFGPETAEPAVAPDVKPDVKPETERPRRTRPDYDPVHIPNPNVDPHPQGRLRRMRSMDYDMPSSEEIEYELEIDDEPKRPMGRRMKDLEREDRPYMKKPMGRMRREMEPEVEENIYEIEIDSDIEELFKK